MMLVALMMLAAGQCPMVMRDTAYGPGGVVAPGVGTLGFFYKKRKEK